jgi:hypothetical protein
MITQIINRASQGRIKYILKTKKYLFCRNENDYFVLSLEEGNIVCRISSEDEERTMKFINKTYKEKVRQNITFKELETITKIPEIVKKVKINVDETTKEINIVVNKINPILDFKVNIIKYIDYYNVRNLENEKLTPDFKKQDEFSIEVYFSNESKGNKNKIIFNVNSNTNHRFKHYYNGKFVKQSINLKDIFE